MISRGHWPDLPASAEPAAAAELTTGEVDDVVAAADDDDGWRWSKDGGVRDGLVGRPLSGTRVSAGGSGREVDDVQGLVDSVLGSFSGLSNCSFTSSFYDFDDDDDDGGKKKVEGGQDGNRGGGGSGGGGDHGHRDDDIKSGVESGRPEPAQEFLPHSSKKPENSGADGDGGGGVGGCDDYAGNGDGDEENEDDDDDNDDYDYDDDGSTTSGFSAAHESREDVLHSLKPLRLSRSTELDEGQGVPVEPSPSFAATEETASELGVSVEGIVGPGSDHSYSDGGSYGSAGDGGRVPGRDFGSKRSVSLSSQAGSVEQQQQSLSLGEEQKVPTGGGTSAFAQAVVLSAAKAFSSTSSTFSSGCPSSPCSWNNKYGFKNQPSEIFSEARDAENSPLPCATTTPTAVTAAKNSADGGGSVRGPAVVLDALAGVEANEKSPASSLFPSPLSSSPRGTKSSSPVVVELPYLVSTATTKEEEKATKNEEEKARTITTTTAGHFSRNFCYASSSSSDTDTSSFTAAEAIAATIGKSLDLGRVQSATLPMLGTTRRPPTPPIRSSSSKMKRSRSSASSTTARSAGVGGGSGTSRSRSNSNRSRSNSNDYINSDAVFVGSPSSGGVGGVVVHGYESPVAETVPEGVGGSGNKIGKSRMQQPKQHKQEPYSNGGEGGRARDGDGGEGDSRAEEAATVTQQRAGPDDDGRHQQQRHPHSHQKEQQQQSNKSSSEHNHYRRRHHKRRQQQKLRQQQKRQRQQKKEEEERQEKQKRQLAMAAWRGFQEEAVLLSVDAVADLDVVTVTMGLIDGGGGPSGSAGEPAVPIPSPPPTMSLAGGGGRTITDMAEHVGGADMPKKSSDGRGEDDKDGRVKRGGAMGGGW